MPPPLLITSPSNPKIKSVVKLRQRSHRDKTGQMVIEGYREIKRALDNQYPVQCIYFAPERFQGSNNEHLLTIAADKGAQLIECSKSAFDKISYRDRPDGLLALAPAIRRSLESFTLPANPLIIVAEAIEKPGNLGTILRSADAAGADAVIVCDRCTDINNPNVVRASIGTLFSLPVIEATSQATIEWLRQHQIKTLAATPHTDRLYTDANLTGPLAIVVGTEQYGLSNLWMNRADIQIKIPMHGQADSLNVAAATTILLFESQRQRLATS